MQRSANVKQPPVKQFAQQVTEQFALARLRGDIDNDPSLMTTINVLRLPLFVGLFWSTSALAQDITAEQTRMEKGIALADGKVTFTDRIVTLHCERLHYDPATREARCFGATQVVINGITIQLSDITYNLKAKQITQGIVEAEK